MLRPALAAAGTAWLAALGPAAAPLAAAQPAAVHRAAVIVDTGTEVKRVCVRFSEESLSGIELLTRAGTDPVLRAFAGKGAAVCTLCGTGCPGDGSCLTCDPGGRFWSYSRAPAGTVTLQTSGVGASSTTVRDGDVEGWRWGTGGTPPFATVAAVCGEAGDATTTTSAPAPPPDPAPTTTTPPGTTARPPASGTVPTTRRPPAPVTAATTTAPGAATPGPGADPEPVATTSAPTTTSTAPPGALVASGDGPPAGGGSPWGLVAFGTALAGLVAWAGAARRRGRRPGG